MKLSNLIKISGNKFASVVSQGTVFDCNEYVNLGHYMFNAQVSGSIYKGLPLNKRLVLGGPSSTGKTYLLLTIIKSFLDSYKNGIVIMFETEGALTKDMIEERGIDVDRLLLMPVKTVEDFRTQALKLLNEFEKAHENKEEVPKVLMALDSLGNLSTKKELGDMEDGKDTRDMTRAQLLKGAFRAITLPLAKLKIPLIVTNHVYDSMGMYSQKVMSGGSGAIYAGDVIIFLSKARNKDGTEVVGGIFTSTTEKSRLSREKTKVRIEVDFEKGINPYSGLIEFAIERGILNKSGHRVEINGEKVFIKTIYKNPEKYFTKELLDKIDEECKKVFLYNSENLDENEIEDIEE